MSKKVSLLQHLYPDQFVPSLFDIDVEALKARGIRGLIFDLDNTIVERGASEFTPEVMHWLERLREEEFRIAIVSNNRTRRAVLMAEEAGIPAIFNASKPLRRPFKRALKILGTKPEETAVVGDQIFTDVFGGNRLGMYTILTHPMPGPEFIGTRLITRKLERLFLPRIWEKYGFNPRRFSNG
ncbi:MAG: YqeG family HAD IIIA-type phosphatase [Bacillota bacterium]